MNTWTAKRATHATSDIAELFWLAPPSPTGIFDSVADGRIDIVTVLSPSKPRLEIHGSSTTPKLMNLDTGVRYAGIRIRPEWGGTLLKDHASLAADEVIQIDRIGKFSADNIAESLANAHTAEDMETILTPAILSIAKVPSANSHWARIACSHVSHTAGTLSIETIAARLGMNRRTLERIFKSEVGISPKTFSRIERLASLAKNLRCATHSWADLAAVHGYSDQAHLSRDVASLTGKTPSALRERILAMPQGWIR